MTAARAACTAAARPVRVGVARTTLDAGVGRRASPTPPPPPPSTSPHPTSPRSSPRWPALGPASPAPLPWPWIRRRSLSTCPRPARSSDLRSRGKSVAPLGVWRLRPRTETSSPASISWWTRPWRYTGAADQSPWPRSRARPHLRPRYNLHIRYVVQ